VRSLNNLGHRQWHSQNASREEPSLQSHKNHEIGGFLGIRRMLAPMWNRSEYRKPHLAMYSRVLLILRRLLISILKLSDQDPIPVIPQKIPVDTESA
jgi:hypothetical protein